MRFAAIFVVSLWAIAGAKPAEFASKLASLPPGYVAGSASETREGLDKAEKVPKGTQGTLQGVSQDAAKPFLIAANGKEYLARDDDFFVKPVGSKCPGNPPYPKIGSHSVCAEVVTEPKMPYMWRCPWEISYGLTDRKQMSKGCSSIKIDCSDSDRIVRILNKYDWIGQRTDAFGPEMRCLECNKYAQDCVAHQCRGFPDPGAAPATPTRLYDADMPQEGLLGSMGSMLVLVTAVFAVTMAVVFIVVRVVRSRTVEHEPYLIDEELEAEDGILDGVQ